MKNIVEKMIELNSFWIREEEDFIVDKKSYVCDGFFDISSICLNSELLSLYIEELLSSVSDDDLKGVTSVFGISRKPEEVLFAAEVAKQLNLKVIYCNSKANGGVVPGKKIIGLTINPFELIEIRKRRIGKFNGLNSTLPSFAFAR
mgnify:CR=1 FL=1